MNFLAGQSHDIIHPHQVADVVGRVLRFQVIQTLQCECLDNRQDGDGGGLKVGFFSPKKMSGNLNGWKHGKPAKKVPFIFFKDMNHLPTIIF